jgi:hypothetical protein
MRRTFHGSCHCQAVRIEVELDLRKDDPITAATPGKWWRTTFRCNCSICMRTRIWKAFVPARDFRLVAGADALGDYQFAGREVHHAFCRTCGMHPFASGNEPQLGGDFYCINVNCLDDAELEELLAAPVAYEDGRNDDWGHPPADARVLGGPGKEAT